MPRRLYLFILICACTSGSLAQAQPDSASQTQPDSTEVTQAINTFIVAFSNIK